MKRRCDHLLDTPLHFHRIKKNAIQPRLLNHSLSERKRERERANHIYFETQYLVSISDTICHTHTPSLAFFMCFSDSCKVNAGMSDEKGSPFFFF
jgi:hypothetical protein